MNKWNKLINTLAVEIPPPVENIAKMNNTSKTSFNLRSIRIDFRNSSDRKDDLWRCM